MDKPTNNKPSAGDCRCWECGTIHSEFIGHFGKWPSMSHEEGQALKRKREENEASWQRMMGQR